MLYTMRRRENGVNPREIAALESARAVTRKPLPRITPLARVWLQSMHTEPNYLMVGNISTAADRRTPRLAFKFDRWWSSGSVTSEAPPGRFGRPLRRAFPPVPIEQAASDIPTLINPITHEMVPNNSA
jgi:hypothetical protein